MTITHDEATGAPLLRTSERGDFKRCPFLWSEVWLKGRKTRREPTWAWFGTAIHRGLEARYLPGGKKRGSLEEMLAAFEESLGDQERRIYSEGLLVDDTEIVDARALGREMLKGYLEEYGMDSHWRVLHTEQPFQINVPDPVTGAVLVVYCGTWDLAVYDLVEKVYKIVDHKTRRSFPKNMGFYNINDQAGSYLWVAPEVLVAKGILKKKDRIEGLVFNALRKHLPDQRPTDAEGYSLNKDGSRSKVQPAPLYLRESVYRSPAERVTQAQRVQAEAVVMSKMRKGELPIYKTPTEDCIRCPIFDFCELHEQDPEAAEEYAGSVLLLSDPYRDHRIDMETKGGVRV